MNIDKSEIDNFDNYAMSGGIKEVHISSYIC